MKKLALLLVIAGLLLAACSQAGTKTPNALIGKWVSYAGNGIQLTVEFNEDGTVKTTTSTTPDQSAYGKYKLVDDHTVEMTADNKVTRFEYKTEGDQLIFSMKGQPDLILTKAN